MNRVEQALAKPHLFLIVVLFGFLLSLYTMLIGLVIYLILAFSDPFQGDTAIEPTSLQYVLQQISQ